MESEIKNPTQSSTAKLAALRRLHARRRGVRVHHPGLTPHQLAGLLADVAGMLHAAHERGRISIRAAARHCRVHARTVARWLDGTNWPDAAMTRRLASWLRSVSQG